MNPMSMLNALLKSIPPVVRLVIYRAILIVGLALYAAQWLGLIDHIGQVDIDTVLKAVGFIAVTTYKLPAANVPATEARDPDRDYDVPDDVPPVDGYQ